jgi:hypothetical protein
MHNAREAGLAGRAIWVARPAWQVANRSDGGWILGANRLGKSGILSRLLKPEGLVRAKQYGPGNAQLTSCFTGHFMRRLAFYFPLGDRGPGLADLLRNTEEGICRRVGGLTSYSAEGLTAKRDGCVERDKIQVLEMFVEEADALAVETDLRQRAAIIAAKLSQRSVAYSVDGQMNFVKAR